MKVGRMITQALREQRELDMTEMIFRAFLDGYDIDIVDGWYFRTEPLPYRL